MTLPPPSSTRRRVRVAELTWRGWPVYEVVPSTGAHRGELVFLAGEGMTPRSWQLVADLVHRSGVRCLAVTRPQASGSGVPAMRLVAEIVTAQGADRVAVVGAAEALDELSGVARVDRAIPFDARLRGMRARRARAHVGQLLRQLPLAAAAV